jgi:hypothetical protein
MSFDESIFRESFDLERGIKQAAERGYYFENDVLIDDIRYGLEREIDSLPLEVGDHITRPINKGKPNEVRQQHERLYVEYGDASTPVANFVIRSITTQVRGMESRPELHDWQLAEIGYQRYRHSKDFIGPHRDRASDQKLSVTFTINGEATVKIFEPFGDCWDYSNIEQIHEYTTGPGSIMLLRAPGLGNGKQVIHQVLPPLNSRAILNLRARPTILEQPKAS